MQIKSFREPRYAASRIIYFGNSLVDRIGVEPITNGLKGRYAAIASPVPSDY